jgi:RimJ/RimL family protein N-acetyltransferase
VCSAVGTTGTTAVDPVRRIGEVARRHGMWHHVDAAYAGSAMICEEFRHHQDGLELVDSYVFNPHKWLFTNFDASVFYVADRTPLIETLSILPPYLQNRATESGAVIDYRDWHVPLGRRFRALKLWFVLRQYGAEGLRHHIRAHVAMARHLEQRILDHPRLETVAPTPFALVSFAHVDGDEATSRIAEAVNASGHSYVTAIAHRRPHVHPGVDRPDPHLLPWANDHYSRSVTQQFIRDSATAWHEGRAFDFAIRRDAEPDFHLGNVSVWYVSRANAVGEVGYWVRTDASRQGICTEAVARILRFGFEDLAMHRLVVRIAVGNRGSERVAEKLGFRLEGTLRDEVRIGADWMDHTIWGLLDREWRTEQARYRTMAWI